MTILTKDDRRRHRKPISCSCARVCVCVCGMCESVAGWFCLQTVTELLIFCCQFRCWCFCCLLFAIQFLWIRMLFVAYLSLWRIECRIRAAGTICLADRRANCSRWCAIYSKHTQTRGKQRKTKPKFHSISFSTHTIWVHIICQRRARNNWMMMMMMVVFMSSQFLFVFGIWLAILSRYRWLCSIHIGCGVELCLAIVGAEMVQSFLLRLFR